MDYIPTPAESSKLPKHLQIFCPKNIAGLDLRSLYQVIFPHDHAIRPLTLSQDQLPAVSPSAGPQSRVHMNIDSPMHLTMAP